MMFRNKLIVLFTLLMLEVSCGGGSEVFVNSATSMQLLANSVISVSGFMLFNFP